MFIVFIILIIFLNSQSISLIFLSHFQVILFWLPLNLFYLNIVFLNNHLHLTFFFFMIITILSFVLIYISIIKLFYLIIFNLILSDHLMRFYAII
jgi:hypothetical protein